MLAPANPLSGQKTPIAHLPNAIIGRKIRISGESKQDLQ
jgi:hypothetical protein